MRITSGLRMLVPLMARATLTGALLGGVLLGNAVGAHAEVDKPGVADPQPTTVDLYAPENEAAMVEFIKQLKERSKSGGGNDTVILGDATTCRIFMESMVDDAARAKLFTADANKIMEAHISQFMRMVQPFTPVGASSEIMQTAYRFMTAQTSRYCLAHPDARLEVAVAVAGKTLSSVVQGAENARREEKQASDNSSGGASGGGHEPVQTAPTDKALIAPPRTESIPSDSLQKLMATHPEL